MTLKEINFWNRLETFISNVGVSDLPGEEEKEMILNVCHREQKNISKSVCEHDSIYLEKIGCNLCIKCYHIEKA